MTTYNVGCFCTGACRVTGYCGVLGTRVSKKIQVYETTPQGWKCPECERVNAPSVLQCPCSVNKERQEAEGA